MKSIIVKFLFSAILAAVAFVSPSIRGALAGEVEADMLTLHHSKSLVLADTERSSKGSDASNVVADACRRVKWIKGKPNLKAKYYIIVRGGTTGYVYKRYTGAKVRNSYTHMESMGRELAVHHKPMKADGRAELILLTNDEDKETTRKFMKECKARFAAADLSEEVFEIPGVSQLSYEGDCVFVRARDGAVIKRASYRNIVPQWESIMMGADDQADDSGQ